MRRDQELEGFIDLGMKKEALRLADEILACPRPRAREIEVALQAVGVFAHRSAYRSGTRRAKIETMIERLPKQARHMAGECLLLHYASVGDYQRAADFMSNAKRFSPQGFYFAVESLIGLDRLEDAVALAESRPALKRGFGDNDYECEALAMIASAKGDHLAALFARLNAPKDTPITRHVIEATAESALALVILHLGTHLQKAEEKRKAAASDSLELCLPGLQLALVEVELRSCERLRAKLRRLIPEASRPLYKLEP